MCNSFYSLQATLQTLLEDQKAWSLAKRNKTHAMKFYLTAENKMTTAE